jgi:hypothetical protein
MDSQRYECILTLAIPARLEEAVFDHLHSHAEWVDGFSSVDAEGFGARVSLDTALEQVRGRASRRLVMMLMRRDDADKLLQSLRAAFRNPHMAYWITPITEFGRFA